MMAEGVGVPGSGRRGGSVTVRISTEDLQFTGFDEPLHAPGLKVVDADLALLARTQMEDLAPGQADPQRPVRLVAYGLHG